MDCCPTVVFVLPYDPIENRVEVFFWLREVDKLSQIKTVILQKRYERDSEAEILHLESKTRVIVEENTLKFEILVGKQQNTGLFLICSHFEYG